MAQRDIFDVLLNMDLSTDEAKKEAEQVSSKLVNIFEKATNLKLNLNSEDIKGKITEIQSAFSKVGATIDSVFDFSGANEKLKEFTVNIKNSQNEISKTKFYVGDNLETATGYTKITQSQQQEKDIQKVVELTLKEEEALKKVQEAQKTGNQIAQEYYNSVYKLASEEQSLAAIDFEKAYGSIGQAPDLWQKIIDKVSQLSELEQKRSAMTEEYKKQADNVKQFKEALDALVQAQQKMGSFLSSGKGDTDEFSVALAQWNAAKNVLEGFGATVTDTGVKITKNSAIVKENQTAFESLDKATKEASVDMISAYAKLGDAANFEVQKRALNDFESALSKLVSTQKRMYDLQSKGKTDTEEYKVLTQQYEAAKQKLEAYGATVTETSVKVEKDSLIVNNNAETYDKISKKLDDVNDKLPIYKARTEDAAKANQGASEKQNTFSDSIQKSVENFIKYQVAMEAINKLTSEFTSAIYDMNEAMTQVRMVTMGSYEDTVQLADSYTQLAKQLGTTTTTVAEGADTWLNV